jgi:hypothetical protein
LHPLSGFANIIKSLSTTPQLAHKEKDIVDNLPLRSDGWKLPDPQPEPEEEQAEPQPEVAIVWNVYKEKGDAKSMALKISLRLPLEF